MFCPWFFTISPILPVLPFFLIRFTSSNYFHTSFYLTLQFFQGFISLQLRSLFFTFQLYHFFPLSPFFIFLPIGVRHSSSAFRGAAPSPYNFYRSNILISSLLIILLFHHFFPLSQFFPVELFRSWTRSFSNSLPGSLFHLSPLLPWGSARRRACLPFPTLPVTDSSGCAVGARLWRSPKSSGLVRGQYLDGWPLSRVLAGRYRNVEREVELWWLVFVIEI